jgi:HK97 family phage prohead protease
VSKPTPKFFNFGFEEGVSIRDATDPTKMPTITGVAVPYNKRSKLLFRSFYEEFKPGAFNKWMADPKRDSDIICTINHDPNKLLARTSSGKLSLTETPNGLAAEVQPADTTYARDLVASIRNGDIRGMSFIYLPTKESWIAEGDKQSRQSLHVVEEAKLYEVCFTSNPAYDVNSVELRTYADERMADLDKLTVEQLTEIEELYAKLGR